MMDQNWFKKKDEDGKTYYAYVLTEDLAIPAIHVRKNGSVIEWSFGSINGFTLPGKDLTERQALPLVLIDVKNECSKTIELIWEHLMELT